MYIVSKFTHSIYRLATKPRGSVDDGSPLQQPQPDTRSDVQHPFAKHPMSAEGQKRILLYLSGVLLNHARRWDLTIHPLKNLPILVDIAIHD